MISPHLVQVNLNPKFYFVFLKIWAAALRKTLVF